jgi:hypothetical protein
MLQVFPFVFILILVDEPQALQPVDRRDERGNPRPRVVPSARPQSG